MNKHEGTQDQE